ncbi:MAG: tol-pal system protein YbgF [Thiomicrorhabdus sp.]|nr:tol-pal system protein YbgF [Thiomicrorhabdus sp.]
MMGNSYPLTPIVVGVLTAMMVGSSALAASPTAQPSIDERLQRIERIIENPVLLQLSRRLGEQQREIQELQDQIDFLKRDLRGVTRTSDKRYKESDDRLSALESATKIREDHNEVRLELPVAPVIPKTGATGRLNDGSDSSMVTQNKDKQPLTPITTLPATQEEKGAYQFAFSLLKNSQYENAIKAFQSFLDSYPKSDLASNSAYWMGEAFYIEQDHQAALNAFNRVVKGYPFSSKVPDAMLRAGDCYDNLAQKSQAKALYAELIALYPKTRAAEKAIKRLEKLK